MSEYYAVQRSGEELQHYGVMGMKWGVRKAIKRSNVKALSRQYKKASKKLAKLEKKANSKAKYVKKAAAYGAGAGIAGTAAIAGASKVAENFMKTAGKATKGVGNLMSKSKKAKIRAAGNALKTAGSDMYVTGMDAGHALKYWGKEKSITRGVAQGLNQFGSNIQARAGRRGTSAIVKKGAAKAGTTAWKAGSAVNKANLSNDAIVRIGAGLAGAGLAAASLRNVHKARSVGKYQQKADQFRGEMRKAFAGTQYARQVGNAGARQGKKKKRR